MKNIVAIIDTMYIGGAQKNLINYLSHLADKKYKITLISLKKSNQYIIPKNIQLIEILDDRDSIMTNLFMVLQIISKEGKDADLIIGFMDYITNYIAYLVSQINSTKLLLASRSHVKENIKYYGKLEEINSSLIKIVYKNPPVLVQSNYIKNELIDFLQVKKRNIYTLSNSIELTKVKKSKLSIFENNKVFIAVARFVKLKRIDLIIEAFAKLIENNYENIKLLIVGYGEEEINLINLVKIKKLETKIIFKRDNKNILSLLKSSTACILASKFEGFSNVILESMSQHTLVIASNIKANKELIKDKKTGLLFKNGKVESLYATMLYSLKNYTIVNNIEDNAYSTLTKYNKKIINKKFGNIIRKTINA